MVSSMYAIQVKLDGIHGVDPGSMFKRQYQPLEPAKDITTLHNPSRTGLVVVEQKSHHCRACQAKKASHHCLQACLLNRHAPDARTVPIV